MNWYNDIDPFACAWLQALIDAGLIPPGVVDNRSICDVSADELSGYAQCHFFAGVGGWPLAFRLAGIPDDAPFDSGSCPCPPFSSAGKKKRCPTCGGRPIPCPRRTGYFICIGCEHAWHADDRHLYPELFRIIRDRRPSVFFGEQVASPDGRIWLAGVRATLELLGYALGGTDLAAASLGAPHIRQRIWFVADANSDRRNQGWRGESAAGHDGTPRDRSACELADTPGSGREGVGWPGQAGASECGRSCGLADAQNPNGGGEQQPGSTRRGRCGSSGSRKLVHPQREGLEGLARPIDRGNESGRIGPHTIGPAPAPSNLGHWSAFDLIPCRDGKARRIEPGTFPLANGIPARMGRLRGYGNAIVPQVAAEFIKAYLETLNHQP